MCFAVLVLIMGSDVYGAMGCVGVLTFSAQSVRDVVDLDQSSCQLLKCGTHRGFFS